jgi:hypothetical protein
MREVPNEAGRLRCRVCGATRSFVLEGCDRIVFGWHLNEQGTADIEPLEWDGAPQLEDRCLVWYECGNDGPLTEFEVPAP